MRLLVVLLAVVVAAAWLQPSAAAVAGGHNITKILAQHPEFSTFNHYLSLTHLASEINRRETITVLAVDNAGMAPIVHLPLYTLKNLLSLHVLVDYFGAKKLHQITGGTALSSTMFQASGAAIGTAGFVNITDHRAGKVTFSADGSGDAPPSSFVKSVKEIPYTLSVLQINSHLSSPAAEAPVPSPAQVNFTDLMSKKGCKMFSSLLASTGDAQRTFESNVDSGLTVFCPIDQAMSAFAPRFKNLTADGKLSLLLYHGLPTYNSIQTLKDGNGLVTTLATDKKNFNFTVQNSGEVVTLNTKINTARITGTLIDEDPLAVFTIDQVLQPRDLFKRALLAPAPAPAPEADDADAPAPEKKKGKKKKKAQGSTESPAPAGPEGEPADQKVDDENAGGALRPWWFAAALMAVAVVAV